MKDYRQHRFLSETTEALCATAVELARTRADTPENAIEIRRVNMALLTEHMRHMPPGSAAHTRAADTIRNIAAQISA